MTTAAKLETKVAPFDIIEVKQDGDSEGLVTGYAAITGNRDNNGDIIERGAFTKTLADRGSKIVYLPPHAWGSPLAAIPGVPVEIKEDDRGLLTKTRFFLDTQSGRDSFHVIQEYHKEGRPFGLSIGYRATKAQRTFDEEGDAGEMTRRIAELEMFEYGHVAIPMNEDARTVEVKGFGPGLTFADDVKITDEALAAVSAYTQRATQLAALRAKDDREFKHRDHIEEQLATLEAIGASMKALLDGAPKSDVEAFDAGALYLEFLNTQRRKDPTP